MQPRHLLPATPPFSPNTFQPSLGPVNNQFVNGQFMGTMNGGNPGTNNFMAQPMPRTNAVRPMPASVVNYSSQSGTMPTPANQNSTIYTFANANMNHTYGGYRSANVYQQLTNLQQENAHLQERLELVTQENMNLRANHQGLLRRASAITAHYRMLRGTLDFEIQPDGRLRPLVPGTIPRQTAVVEPGVPVPEAQAQHEARVTAWAGSIVPNDPYVLLPNNGNTVRPLTAPVLRRPEHVDLTDDDDGSTTAPGSTNLQQHEAYTVVTAAQAPTPAYAPQPAVPDAAFAPPVPCTVATALALGHPIARATSTPGPAQQSNPGQRIAGQRRRRESESDSASVATPVAPVPVVSANPEPSPPVSNDGDSMAPSAKRAKKTKFYHWMNPTENEAINQHLGYINPTEEQLQRHAEQKQAEANKLMEIEKAKNEEEAAKKKEAEELRKKETARRRQETARKRREMVARRKEEAAKRKEREEETPEEADEDDAIWAVAWGEAFQKLDEEKQLKTAATVVEEDQDVEADDDEEEAGATRENVLLNVGDATVNTRDKDGKADEDDYESDDSLFN